jgi:alkylation response protein AidB-like acyl-CoA dehydrogenase
MLSYTPPLKDMLFVLNDVLAAPTLLAQLPAHADVDEDLMREVLDQAGRFARDVIFPLNASGDAQGCSFDKGAVRTPDGYADAYRQFRDGGWPALACAPEDGGQGLPHTLNCALFEMLAATNHGWTMYPDLLHGAYSCLRAHGSEELKQRYLDKIASGEWLTTMCLTESHAGSDLGLLRTKAEPQPDGSHALSGNKIFISGGEHDLTDNILHLVLARLPDAPVGNKGISLFLVPKFLPDGQRNGVHCTGIEHKMGVHGSATCSMQFEGATGWLVGQEHRGLNAMFVMMNSARLHVGVQGLGIGETAYQNSLAYARERVQSRAVERTPGTKAPADAIVQHPAVQRLLMNQRTSVEGGRMLAYWSGLMLDQAEHSADAAQRAAIHDLLALITPIVKAVLTQQGFDGASQALQVFGGHGYVTETGIEQYIRDARITMVYEGTNEIQAIDLLMRKVLADGGRCLSAWLDQVDAYAAGMPAGPASDHARQLLALSSRLRTCLAQIDAARASRPRLPYDIAGEFMQLVSHCAFGWLWLRAEQAADRVADRMLADAKLTTACYYFNFIFPATQQYFAIIDASIANVDAHAFPQDLINQHAS